MKLYKKRKKPQPVKMSKVEALRLSGCKYWIVTRESDEQALRNTPGVTLGEIQRDASGAVKRAKGLITFGGCTITDDAFELLFPDWAKKYMWGPDVPDDHMKKMVQRRGHTFKEFDWKKNRGEVDDGISNGNDDGQSD